MRTGCPVVVVSQIDPHPDADKLDLVTVQWTEPYEGGTMPYQIRVVTGKHYREGQLGVWIPPSAFVPGYLAQDLWLVGEEKANDWVLVMSKVMRGVLSPGLFCGAEYSLVRDDSRSQQRHADNVAGGATAIGDWSTWRYWRPRWRVGDDAAAWLGVRFE